MSIASRIINHVQNRAPDFIVGGLVQPYMLRWYMIPRKRSFNIYVHKFLRSDDERALHDHRSWNLSILLRGEYTEHTIKQGGVHISRVLRAGDWKARFGGTAHRIELHKGICWTLFIVGPHYRDWGFHCPNGWIPWQKFTDPDNPGSTGKGCDQ